MQTIDCKKTKKCVKQLKKNPHLTSASSVALGLKFLQFVPNSLEKIQIFAKSRLKKNPKITKKSLKKIYIHIKSPLKKSQ